MEKKIKLNLGRKKSNLVKLLTHTTLLRQQSFCFCNRLVNILSPLTYPTVIKLPLNCCRWEKIIMRIGKELPSQVMFNKKINCSSSLSCQSNE